MAFRIVYTEFWTDPKVMEDMTPEDKYFYLYLMTNPCTNMIGIYRIVKKQMAFDLGYSIESINSLMDRFINSHKLILYNEETKELCIKNYGKYNLNKGGKPMMDCIKKDLENVIDKSLIKEIVINIKNSCVKQFIEEYLFKLNNVSTNDTYNSKGDDTSSDTLHESYKNEDLERMAKTGTFDDTSHDTQAIRGHNHKPITNNHNPISNNQYPNTKQQTNNNESSVVNIADSEIYKHFQKCGFGGNDALSKFIATHIPTYGAKWMIEAANVCVSRDKINNYGYLLGILQNWETKSREQSHVDFSKESKQLKFNNFESRQYDYDVLERKLLGWDSD